MLARKAALVLNLLVVEKIGGGDRTRTRYLLLAKQPLSQLSYTPTKGVQALDWWV